MKNIDTIDKCDPCWSFNISFNDSNRENKQRVQCFIFWNYNHLISKCPCRKCLIRSTCFERCDERYKFAGMTPKRLR
ncbi:MAG: hypothetical protein ACFFG0_00160 [Candidatus Thorarchaeota archaeon]